MKKEKFKLYLFGIDKEDQRIKAFFEAGKKLNVKVYFIDAYKCLISKEGVKYEGKILKINKSSFFWFLGNAMANQYIILALGDKVNIWPSEKVFKIFSDKFKTAVFFNKLKINTPKTVLINLYEEKHIEEAAKEVGGFPAVIKNVKGSQGANVGKVNSVKEVKDFIINEKKRSLAKSNTPYKKFAYILQEYISFESGSDYRVLCLGNEIIGGIKRTSKTDFRANISLGGSAASFTPNQKIKTICTKIIKESGVLFAGIDFIKKDDRFLAIEVNTSGEFFGFQQATGIYVAEKIIRFLKKS